MAGEFLVLMMTWQWQGERVAGLWPKAIEDALSPVYDGPAKPTVQLPMGDVQLID